MTASPATPGANVRLSEHFWLSEFIVSDAAAELRAKHPGEAEKYSNRPGPEHLVNLRELAASLQAVRAFLGNRPIVISSAYRSPVINRAVKGSNTSAHPHGWAADFHVAGLSDLEAARALAESGLPFDQLIYEKGRCVHWGLRWPKTRGQRRQVLSQPGGPRGQIYEGIRP